MIILNHWASGCSLHNLVCIEVTTPRNTLAIVSFVGYDVFEEFEALGWDYNNILLKSTTTTIMST